MINRLDFISFQSIHNGVPNGAVKAVLPWVDYLSKSKYEIYYTISSVDHYIGNLRITEVGPLYQFVAKLFILLNHFLFKLNNGPARLVQEKLFDFFISLKINKPTVIISTAFLYRALKKNKKVGGINIFIAGNPDDFEIHNILVNEQRKFNVSFNDAYTYKKRIDYGTNSIFTYDQIICITKVELESFQKRIPSEKISFIESHIIPNPFVFPEIDVVKNNELTFCYVAHTVWLKGIVYLLEAWEKSEIKNSRLLIAGTVNKEVKAYIDKKYSDIKSIEFRGSVNDLNQFLRTSHICIIPSLLDAGPATVAEAMYCGLPVIVTDGCGARSLVKEGVNGFVVPKADANAIAEKIEWFNNNQNLINNMGLAAKVTIKELTKGNQTINVAEHILHVINKLNL